MSIVRATKHQHLLQSSLTYLQEIFLYVWIQEGILVKDDTENRWLNAFWNGA